MELKGTHTTVPVGTVLDRYKVNECGTTSSAEYQRSPRDINHNYAHLGVAR